jgi:hypothetical protein
VADDKTAPPPQKVPSVTVANTISMIVIIGFFAFVFLPAEGSWSLPDARFNVVWPQLIALVSAVIGYQLGSSKQAERQTELLAKPAEIVAVPPVPPGTTVTTKTTVTPVPPVEPAGFVATTDEERLAKMEAQLLALPPGADRDKLTEDIAALRAKIAAKG